MVLDVSNVSQAVASNSCDRSKSMLTYMLLTHDLLAHCQLNDYQNTIRLYIALMKIWLTAPSIFFWHWRGLPPILLIFLHLPHPFRSLLCSPSRALFHSPEAAPDSSLHGPQSGLPHGYGSAERSRYAFRCISVQNFKFSHLLWLIATCSAVEAQIHFIFGRNKVVGVLISPNFFRDVPPI